MKFSKILSMAIAFIMAMSIQVVIPAVEISAADREPWEVKIINDPPLLKDENGQTYDLRNPWSYADPEIHRFDGKFWIYATRSQEYYRQLNQDAFSSDDLITWTKHEAIIDEASVSDAWRCLWAPTVSYKDGWYYILFGTNDLNLGSATGEYSTGDVGGMYLLRSRKPEGPFEQFMGKNVPLIPDNYFGAQAIDANMFLDDDNTMYLVYGGWSTCLMAKFKDDMTGFVPLGDENWKKNNNSDRNADDLNEFSDYFVHLTDAFPSRGSASTPRIGEINYNMNFNGRNEYYTEGPIVYKLDGLYYLMYCVGGWTSDTYGIRYAIARNPLGPYTTIPGRFLQSRHSVNAQGTGHHSMVYIEENDLWLNTFHRRPNGGARDDRFSSMDVAHMYDGEVTLIDYDPTKSAGNQVFLESSPTKVRLFEPTIPTFYWSSKNPLPKNLAGYVQNVYKLGIKPSYSAVGQSSGTTVAGSAFDAGINADSYWQSNNADAGRWLQVDFGQPTTFNEIQIYFRQLGSSANSISSTTRIQLQVSDNGTDWTDIINPGSNPGRTLTEAERVRRSSIYYFFREALTTPVTSRYFRIYSPDAVTVGILEAEVYNIENVNQLIALQNAGAKIEEVTPGTIPTTVMAQLEEIQNAQDSIIAPAGEADLKTMSEITATPAMEAIESNFDDSQMIGTFAATDDSSAIGPIAVTPGSGMRGSTDPWVVYDNGYYYYVRTENETSITVAKSPRLEDIGKAKKVTVWDPEYADGFKLLRSPRMQKIGDKWYLYVSVSDGNDHRVDRNLTTNLWNENYSYDIYALEADSPLGPFTMKGIVNTPGQWSADGTVMQHPNGKDYFVWSGRIGDEPESPDGPAKLVKVSTSTTGQGDQGVKGMFDGLTSTKLYTDIMYVTGSGQAANGGLNVDMEYSKPITINKVRIGNAADSNSYPGRQPRAFTIRGSNDGVNWDAPFYTTTNPGLPTTNNALTTIDLGVTVTYKYYRWNVTTVGSTATNGNGFQCSEFNLVPTQGEIPLLPGDAQPKQALFIQEMANPWTLAAGGRKMISEPTLSWEQSALFNLPTGVMEGPTATVRGDDIYIFYSGNTTTHVNTGIGMLRAVATSDPTLGSSWTKSANRVFYGGSSTSINNTNGVFYVRQPNFVKSPDGTEDWLLYHAGSRSYGNAAANATSTTAIRQFLNSKKDRSVRMQEIVWDDNGNPSFAVATTGTSALAGNAAMSTQRFSRPSGTINSDIYVIEAEDATLTGVINTDKNASGTTNLQGLRARNGIVNQWLRGGNETTGGGQDSASGGYGTYYNASGGLTVRLGKDGVAKYEVNVAKAGIYDLTVMGVALEYNAKQIVDVNGTKYEMTHTLYSQRYGGLFTPQTQAVKLEEGKNVITISNKPGSLGAVIDYIYINDLRPEEISVSDSIDITAWSWNKGADSYYSGFKLVPKEDMNVKMIIAGYDIDGVLVFSDVRPLTITAGVSLGENIDVADSTADKYKVFFWDTTNGPLSDVVSFIK